MRRGEEKTREWKEVVVGLGQDATLGYSLVVGAIVVETGNKN